MSGARRIGVVGAGLIGGSLIKAIAANPAMGPSAVVVYEAQPAVRATLAAAGFALADDPAALARAVDLVIIAAPPAATAPLAAALLTASPTVVVSDTASVKEAVVDAVAAATGREAFARFVPGHPLAGGERSGWEHADPRLLEGALWALCPVEGRTDPGAAVAVIAALSGLVGARVLAVDAHEHDLALAHTSHMPHLAASALMLAATGERSALRMCLSGGALRDGTRVAGADADLWVEILRDNATNTVAALDDLIVRLGELRDVLDTEDWEGLGRRWRAGVRQRDALTATRWSAPGDPRRIDCEPTVAALLDLGRRGVAIAGVARAEPPWAFDVIGG